jgi:hypothetical protein
VGDWLYESRTAKHCLNEYVDPSKARPTQANSGAQVELKGLRFMHYTGLEASFVGTAAYERQAVWTSGKAHELAISS